MLGVLFIYLSFCIDSLMLSMMASNKNLINLNAYFDITPCSDPLNLSIDL